MASMIPVVRDILPILSPGDVISVKSSELDEGTGQTEGMIRKGAIVGKCDKLCASDTVVYAARGHGTIVTNPLSEPSDTAGLKRINLAPGDFALIPAYCEHQEVNDGDEEVEWIITRSGSTPVVVNLEAWGGKEVKS